MTIHPHETPVDLYCLTPSGGTQAGLILRRAFGIFKLVDTWRGDVPPHGWRFGLFTRRDFFNAF